MILNKVIMGSAFIIENDLGHIIINNFMRPVRNELG
jgi:hypothetical protein